MILSLLAYPWHLMLWCFRALAFLPWQVIFGNLWPKSSCSTSTIEDSVSWVCKPACLGLKSLGVILRQMSLKVNYLLFRYLPKLILYKWSPKPLQKIKTASNFKSVSNEKSCQSFLVKKIWWLLIPAFSLIKQLSLFLSASPSLAHSH